MKKSLLLLAFVFAALVFTSCNPEDDIVDAIEDAYDYDYYD